MTEAQTRPERTAPALYGDGAKGMRMQVWRTTDPCVFCISRKADRTAPWTHEWVTVAEGEGPIDALGKETRK